MNVRTTIAVSNRELTQVGKTDKSIRHTIHGQSLRQRYTNSDNTSTIGLTLQTHHSGMCMSVTMTCMETQDAVTGEEAWSSWGTQLAQCYKSISLIL